MVKLSLSFLSVAVAVVSATSYSAQNRFTDHYKDRCLPGTSVKENQPFHLLTSSRLNYVSTFLDGDLLIEGADGNKDLQRLQFCVVLGDEECTETSGYCILEDTEYRVRVHGPEKGYLRAEGYHVRVVEEYEEASDISLVWETGGVHIATKDRSDNGEKCLPDTLIKEYNPFQLFSYDLDNYVSRKVDTNLLVGGRNGDKSFQQLQFCVVSSDRACTTMAFPPACIYQNAQYRVRVQGPAQGYLRVSGGQVDIVEHYSHASVLTMFKGDDWGLRIGYVNGLGEQYVLATKTEGEPIVLEPPKEERVQQFFDLVKLRKDGQV
ncbi:hypothetical protein BGZ82_005967 [Podila clonocystis]|nr:hypothetical protein BGZ82_005967 [Podila clonocystis]